MHLDITTKIDLKIKEENRVEAIIDRSSSKILTSTVLLLKPGIMLSVTFTGFAGMVIGQQGQPAKLPISGPGTGITDRK
jgi:heme O synthase-like polyprenyltransferase